MTAYPSRTVVNLQQSDGRSHSGTKELQLIRDLIDSDKARVRTRQRPQHPIRTTRAAKGNKIDWTRGNILP